MYYIVEKASPQYHQIGLEDLFFGDDNTKSLITTNLTNTRTRQIYWFTSDQRRDARVPILIKYLKTFNESTEYLRVKNRNDLYRTYHIPKKSGGLRRIDEPIPELMESLNRLKDIFEIHFKFKNYELYHTSAFAYIKGRCVKDVGVRHQQNESKWFLKTDLTNFFGSTTIEFLEKMLSMVYPFCLVMQTAEGKEELMKAVELAFKDGGLPQGTPISPLLTNIMMIPIDYKLANELRDFNKNRYVYTRYADDFIISSKYNFDYKSIVSFINGTLKEFDAPFKIKDEKTKYGSSSGSNWILGMVLNANNELTVGYKNKRKFQAMLSSYIMDKKKGVQWDKTDVQIMEGHRAWYSSVEGDTIDRIIDHINQKFSVDVRKMIAADLAA